MEGQGLAEVLEIYNVIFERRPDDEDSRHGQVENSNYMVGQLGVLVSWICNGVWFYFHIMSR